MRPPKIIPEWFLQVMLSGAGIGLTGGIWYFMSVQKYHTALWWGFTSIIVFLLAAALYIRNDLLRSEQQTAANLSTAITPSVPQRPEESKVDLQGETPAEKETLIETYPPVSTAQNMTKEQVLPNLTPDKATPALAPERATIREKSAAEIIINLKGIKHSYQFQEKVEELYRGRWTREPGWQAKVYDLPSRLPEGLWNCSFTEIDSDTLVWAITAQDVSMLRRGDPVTVSGKISGVGQLNYISLEDAIVRGDNVPFP